MKHEDKSMMLLEKAKCDDIDHTVEHTCKQPDTAVFTHHPTTALNERPFGLIPVMSACGS